MITAKYTESETQKDEQDFDLEYTAIPQLNHPRSNCAVIEHKGSLIVLYGNDLKKSITQVEWASIEELKKFDEDKVMLVD
mgnify:CR=1 FL=1